MDNIQYARKLLKENQYTCVVCSGETVYTSVYRGVKPLISWYEQGIRFDGYSAADRVIGKATAFLYVLLGIKAVFAGVISRSALQVFQDNGIHAEYDLLVENIINRRGDGICPFEQAVLTICSKDEAYRAIQKKMTELQGL